MSLKSHTISYQSTKPYYTLNNLTSETKNIWLVFHGMGFLSRYFFKPFMGLDATENYFISPQAPSKYYLDEKFKHVGASWLTREDLQLELSNVLTYVDGVFEAENLSDDKNLILFGFSQGVSIATRWLARRKICCDSLLLYAGGIPNELQQEDFDFLDLNKTSVKIIYGDDDKYITDERVQSEGQKIKKLFQEKAEIVRYNGGHEIHPDVLNSLF
ncbi:esterase [Allomuricauda sp. d1]|uniref:alpha/beta hydrolase n=1 Tax=Allomuricauda sp. d1 TaxID=3136725 RepID=UPI0031D39033